MRLGMLETRSAETGATRPVTPDLLAATFLSPLQPRYGLADALKDFHAPWSASHAVAPSEVETAVASILRDLAVATPGMTVDQLDLSGMPDGRARDHMTALKALWTRMEDALPPELAAMRHALRSETTDAVEPLPVTTPECSYETRAEADLRKHLGTLFGVAGPYAAEEPFAPGALGVVQSTFAMQPGSVPPDTTLQVYGLRNPLEELAFAAARTQALVAGGLRPQDVGVLVPDEAAYLTSLEAAFARVGLAVTGMPAAGTERDHVGELLLNLLAAFKGPVPRMALASIALSPLLPLPPEERRRIAHEFASRGWSATARESAASAIFDEIRPVSTPGQLLAKLACIAELVTDGSALTSRINGLRPILAGEGIDWLALTRAVEPRGEATAAVPRFVEGVSIFTEDALPWRGVRHLIVLGLAGPHWPKPSSGTPFFTEGELEMIERTTGIVLPTRARTVRRRLELFRRQLCAATDAATLTVSARDLNGKRLPPSTALSLIARRLGSSAAEDIVADPHDGVTGGDLLHHRVVAWHVDNGSPILPDGGEVTLGRNPFHLRVDGEGNPRPQSPTALETLFVSPLAWLLGELGAEDRTWCPERLDVMMLGNIVHATLEGLFPAGEDPRDEAGVETAVDATFAAALRREAVWLEDPAWSVERANLLREVRRAALGWLRFLRANGATVRAVETWLQGVHASGIQVRGKSDCLLALPDGRLIVVDHKRSSSGRRRRRMEAGSDLQVELYRGMIRQSPEFAGLDPGGIVTAYHCTLDGRILAGPEGAGLQGARALSGDVGGEATTRLGELVATLSRGVLHLNTADQANAFERMGISPYPLTDNTIVRAFMMPAAEESRDVADAE